MSKQTYGWKRFWCPRSGTINLADGGYLYDPDAEWGKACNPDLVSLKAITDVPCLVLLGEPGIGKSQELENLKAFTNTKICDSSQVLEINLRSCTNLKEDLFKDETFTDWLENSYHLYFNGTDLRKGRKGRKRLQGLVDIYQSLASHRYNTFYYDPISRNSQGTIFQKPRIAVARYPARIETQ